MTKEDIRDEYEERAAIKQYDGKMTRFHAENEAAAEMRQKYGENWK